ncbi:MAG: right-handed parallel beta-helix repeat-containing protein [Prevotellaceae bacterium]|nr:right-handed parallel beta-helix repeat-containing protein [Prevotellaceae bacterium]
MKRLSGIILLLSALVAFTACDEDISWTTSPSAQLTFSADTVAFDTLITGLLSPQQTLIAFNRGIKGLRIKSVALAGGASSPFMANVDGQYLVCGGGQDFEVFGKDSIYIRLAVRLPETDSDLIQSYTDELQFTLESGVRQSVTLTAQGMDVVVLRGSVVAADETFSARRPYLVYDSLVVAQGCTLTLPEGCTLMFHDSTSLLVHGTLLALGTVESPVTFRGDRTDRMFSYLPYDNTPNRWGGIHFFSDSRGNELTQCDIHAGDYGIICDSTGLDNGTETDPLLTLGNSVVHNVGGTGLSLTSCATLVTGTQISNTLGDCVSILGGAHTFVHCTLAQFYPFSTDRGSALRLANYSDGVFYPLLRCHFLNCVVTGYADDELMGNISEDEESEPCDYLFSHCLLRTEVSGDQQRFTSIVYDTPDSLEISGSAHFTLFDTYNFLYDFAPDSLSAIRGLADPQLSSQFPIDRRGTSRLADEAPDAGAYEGL